MSGKIRPIALCVFKQGDRLLLEENHDPVKNETYYRPLGGGIEFGEPSQAAAIREIQEELGAEITNLRLLGIIENIFTYKGQPGHEIVVNYIADLVDPSFYNMPIIEANDNGVPFRAVWKYLGDFVDGRYPLYPDGLLDLLLKFEANGA
jgi:ADP-ribose pyrophosphatase YjhB (NUDIX family)